MDFKEDLSNPDTITQLNMYNIDKVTDDVTLLDTDLYNSIEDQYQKSIDIVGYSNNMHDSVNSLDDYFNNSTNSLLENVNQKISNYNPQLDFRNKMLMDSKQKLHH